MQTFSFPDVHITFSTYHSWTGVSVSTSPKCEGLEHYLCRLISPSADDLENKHRVAEVLRAGIMQHSAVNLQISWHYESDQDGSTNSVIAIARISPPDMNEECTEALESIAYFCGECINIILCWWNNYKPILEDLFELYREFIIEHKDTIDHIVIQPVETPCQIIDETHLVTRFDVNLIVEGPVLTIQACSPAGMIPFYEQASWLVRNHIYEGVVAINEELGLNDDTQN